MDQPLSRRAWLRAAAAGLAGVAGALGGSAALLSAAQPKSGRPAAPAAKAPTIAVYKSPACGCCTAWVNHLRKSGFTVNTTDSDDVDSLKQQLGVPAALASCHTAMVSGFVVEGHVPADVIKKMLRERPSIAGIAVPGMPTGSPGMESLIGQKDPYDVVAFDRKGKTSVYASFR